MELYHLTIHELRDKLKKKEISSYELTKNILERIEKIDPKIHALLSVHKEEALNNAKKCDEEINKGIDKPLLGIPIAVKDNICVKGWEITCASRILKGFVAPYDAKVIQKLKEAGAILIGTANMDEFAMGSSTENSAYGPTLNPWDLSRVPGGSSGGSAAAVSAGLAAAALGSDTGGSIRQPASFCSVVGMKPTYGSVSRYGLVAFASSLDQIGPITKDVRDCASMFSVIAGADENDSTSVYFEKNYEINLSGNIKKMKIGIPKEYFTKDIDNEVRNKIEEAIAVYKKLGADIKEVSLPGSKYCLEVYYIKAPAEASSNLARFDGVKYGKRIQSDNLWEMYKNTRGEGFGDEVKRRIMLGTYALSAGYYDEYYNKARKVRKLIMNEFEKVFKECDILLSPVSPVLPFKIGEKINNPLAMYLSDILTISANLAYIPALSIPAGFSKNNLPIGMQIMGNNLDENKILNAAYAYEQATEWHLKRPLLD